MIAVRPVANLRHLFGRVRTRPITTGPITLDLAGYALRLRYLPIVVRREAVPSSHSDKNPTNNCRKVNDPLVALRPIPL